MNSDAVLQIAKLSGHSVVRFGDRIPNFAVMDRLNTGHGGLSGNSSPKWVTVEITEGPFKGFLAKVVALDVGLVALFARVDAKRG